jgi:hypothetical protein
MHKGRPGENRLILVLRGMIIDIDNNDKPTYDRVLFEGDDRELEHDSLHGFYSVGESLVLFHSDQPYDPTWKVGEHYSKYFKYQGVILSEKDSNLLA